MAIQQWILLLKMGVETMLDFFARNCESIVNVFHNLFCFNITSITQFNTLNVKLSNSQLNNK